jgi:citrate lyase subunit beta/citryl-CoA lyase
MTAPRPLVAPLFVPATRPERFAKAAVSGADAIIIDLEDAVPAAQKDAARANLAGMPDFSVEAFVRVNAIGTAWFEADLDALASIGCQTICLPKAETPDLIDQIVTRLGPDVDILAQIETARGLRDCGPIICHPNVLQLAFGPADFYLDMRMSASARMTNHALCALAVASRAAGKASPLDGPAFAINDQDVLARECGSAAAAGCGGKLCIHPSQIEVVKRSFLPKQSELDWAHWIIAADQGGAAQMVDGQMIDAPIVERARWLLDRAGA